ncbi:MAG: ATP-binding protein [Oscillospiraceae bacterium]
MRNVFAVIMAIFTVIAFFYATRVFYNRNYRKITYRLFSMMAFASGLWSLGYGMMAWTDDFTSFACFRAVGVIGMILYVIIGQVVLVLISGKLKKLYPVLAAEGVLGVGLMVLITMPSSFEMRFTDNGITSDFTSLLTAVLNYSYFAALGVVFAVVAFRMITQKHSQRTISFGKTFLRVGGLVAAGMLIDVIIYASGVCYNFSPGAIVQFFGLEITYYAMHKLNRNKLGMENMTEYIYNSLKSPVFLLDNEHKLFLKNKQADTMFGLSGDDGIGKADFFWEKLFGMKPPVNIAQHIDTLTVDAISEWDQTHFRLYIDPIYDQYGDYIGYIVVATDMSENIRAMQAIENAKNEAELANRTKSLFLANMSHEIRTPMNSILGFSEVALKENIDDISRGYFNDIHTSAEMLLSIINDILDISKIESGKVELANAPYYSADVFREVSTVIGMQAQKKGLQFAMNISEDFPNELCGDKDRIREILINLLNNAIKYTNRGSVGLEASVCGKAGDTASIRFRITDTGIGIKKEELAHIFEKFRRVDAAANSATEGTGLGLSITKGYVDLMGGKISVESEYGVGSAFIAEIDQRIVDGSPIKQAGAQSKSAENGKLMFKGLNVLAVDDNRMNLKLISKIMSVHGLEIDTADSGIEAIEKCREKNYDIVLLDHMMPEMDGVEAMNRIRRLGGGYEKGGANLIIALTANALNGAREEMMSLGFDEFLSKPIDVKTLDAVFIGLLDSSHYEYV